MPNPILSIKNTRQVLTLVVLIISLVQCISKEKTSIQKQQVKTDNKELKLDTLFKKGDNGYKCFRIPAVIVTNDGSVLVFSEARKNGCSDTGNIDLVMKKSSDNGKTWGPLKVIWDDSENVCGNPTPVVDKKTGRVHLLTTWNLGEDHESKIINGTSKKGREIFHLVSNDNGDSWSTPKNITESVKLPNWTWYATGPVHGIQLKKGEHKGRLVIPCDHIEAITKKYRSHVFYSDNNGETWQLGGIAPDDFVNECTVAELENGNLMLNMRNYNRDSIKGRQVAFSSDGGLTWHDQYIDENLPEPICQGALLAVEKNKKNILLFSNPSSTNSRSNMMVSVSRDEGNTWTEKISIYKKHAAYSDMSELKNGKIIIVFEAGIKNAYEGIFIKKLELEEE